MLNNVKSSWVNIIESYNNNNNNNNINNILNSIDLQSTNVFPKYENIFTPLKI
jgi:uracil DNA glycosylase